MEKGKRFVKVERPPRFLRKSQDGRSLMELLKGGKVGDYHSAQDPKPGRKHHPFNFDRVIEFKDSDPHHSTCIETKKEATVGLGLITEEERGQKLQQQQVQWEGGIQPPQEARGMRKEESDLASRSTSKAEEVLDKLCAISWQDVIGDIAEDYWQTGNGYMEVVRSGDEIVSIHHIPAGHVFVYVEDEQYNLHYEIEPYMSRVDYLEGGVGGASSKRFCQFGDKEDYIHRNSIPDDPDIISEVIHFRKPSSRSRWYGYPDWIAAVPKIELTHCLDQHQLDFFNNRGVPEFMLFLLGPEPSEEQWKELEKAMRANIGIGNSFKSVVMNFPEPETRVQLEKLEAGKQNAANEKDLAEQWALGIVTAHRVPPLLAGIQIPGKLGAANEIVSAMKAFQTLVIGPAQKVFETTLNKTLGGGDGVSGLGVGDFEFRTITQEMEVAQLDTVSRMRQEFNGPENEGRDPNEGLKNQ